MKVALPKPELAYPRTFITLLTAWSGCDVIIDGRVDSAFPVEVGDDVFVGVGHRYHFVDKNPLLLPFLDQLLHLRVAHLLGEHRGEQLGRRRLRRNTILIQYKSPNLTPTESDFDRRQVLNRIAYLEGGLEDVASRVVAVVAGAGGGGRRGGGGSGGFHRGVSVQQ